MSAIFSSQSLSSSLPISTDTHPGGMDHAAPLSPLRSRDLKAMVELFHLSDIEVIEQDIIQTLVLRYPEPCWEDQVFDFLKEYL
jgi:hypothetical protein